jgi:hypothetical protein
MYNGIRDLRLEEVASARIRHFADYWRARLRGRDVPQRDDIELSDIVLLLPYMFVAEIEAEPFRVRYRLAGTNTVEMNGVNVTGHYLDQLQGDQADWGRDGVAFYRAAWEGRRQVYGLYHWPTELGTVCSVEFGLFPVGLPGGEIQIFAVEEWRLTGAAASLDRPRPLFPDKPAAGKK